MFGNNLEINNRFSVVRTTYYTFPMVTMTYLMYCHISYSGKCYVAMHNSKTAWPSEVATQH